MKTSLCAFAFLLAWACTLPAQTTAQIHGKVLYSFQECGEPAAPLVADSRNNLYGMTTRGGIQQWVRLPTGPHERWLGTVRHLESKRLRRRPRGSDLRQRWKFVWRRGRRRI